MQNTYFAQSLTGLAAASALLGSLWCKLVFPSFAQGGQDRIFNSIAWRVDVGAGVSAGAIQLYELCLDGNFRVLSGAPQSLTASTSYSGIVSPTSLLGFAIGFSTALVGGPISYMEARATANKAIQ